MNNKDKEESISENPLKDAAKSITDDLLTRLGVFFANERDKKDYSVRKLRDISGVSVPVISELENQKSMPRIETIVQLALALDITDMNKVFSNFMFDDTQVQAPTPFKQIRQSLAELELTNGEIQQIMQYTKYILYLREKRLEKEQHKNNVSKTNDK